MKECPYCGISINDEQDNCWYCNADLTHKKGINASRIEDINRINGSGIPITPFEIVRRMKDVPKVLEWSKRKHLTVSGPEFWGVHHVYDRERSLDYKFPN